MTPSAAELKKMILELKPKRVIASAAWFEAAWDVALPSGRWVGEYRPGEAVVYLGTVIVNADYVEPTAILDLTGPVPTMRSEA